MSSFFAYLSRLRLIRRWSLMRNTQSENVLEHSAITAVIAHALATIDAEIYGNDVDPNRVGVSALFHESAEVVTGDLPTPVKYCTPEITEAYKKIEQSAEAQLIATLPQELRDAYAPLVSPDRSTREYRLAKFADKLAAFAKCIEEMRMGNAEFKSAFETYTAQFQAETDPAVRYFLDNFMPAFGLTLDEIKL